MEKSSCSIKCSVCKDIQAELCHQGLPVEKCPKNKLETEKLFLSIVLILAVTVLVISNCCQITQ